MNADDAGAIRRSSRGARSIALPPSLPDDSIPSPSPSSFFSPVRRRQRRDDAHERVPREQSPSPSGSRPVLAFVARLRRRSRRRVHRIRSIDRSFPRADECRVPRKNESVVKSDGSTSIRDRRFSSLNMWWYECTHHRSYYLLCGQLLSTRTVYTYDSGVSSDASETTRLGNVRE